MRFFRLLLPFVLVTAANAQAVVSGVLARRTLNGDWPAQGIPVTVWCTSQNIGRSQAAYSGPNGYWSLMGIPPGQYILEVWVTPQRPWTFPLTVNSPQVYVGTIYVP